MNKKDMYIKSNLQQDKKISNQANEVFKKFEGGINLENNNKPKERKVFKLNLKQAVLAFSSLMIVAVLGGNLYAHLNGKPNLYSAIKGLFVKEDKYTASEIEVNQTVESNGIKLTLKTVAMDENILITKYVAEGEKLASEFYTYPEFEEDMIKVIKIRNVIAGNDIGESGYENYTLKDVTTMRREIVTKLQVSGITEEEAKDIEQMATEAYTEYIGVELGHEGYSSEEAQELITQTIAMFESKVASKYQIMISNDTLQEFSIDAISQKIEKSGNQYIIYNVYNVDTISDLASEFNLSINVTQIGSTKGTWNFSTELEKARLDTRVETIDFYNNNKTTIEIDDERSITVEVKRIVISDFSSVIMIQTNMNELNLTDDLPVPFTYIVRSGNDNSSTKIVGTGNEEILLSGGKVTDRIILDEVDFNVKHIWVDIYSKDGKYLDFINMPEIRDEKYAKSLELTQSFASKEVQVSFKYPGDWTTKETMDAEVILVGPEDVDGNTPTITIRKISKEDYENIKDYTLDYGHETLLEKGETTIAGAKGYYGITTFVDIGMYEKSKIIVLENNGEYYYLRLTTNTDVEYSRYEETFNKILETIEFVEPEKSYVTYYMDNSSESLETAKVYEDNTATVQVSQRATEIFEKGEPVEVEANEEYEITGIDCKIIGMEFMNDTEGGAYSGSYLFIYGEEMKLYLVDMHRGISTGKFEAVEININNRLTNPQCEEIEIDEEISAVAVVVYDKDGQGYIILRDGTVEKYNKPEPLEENNQQQPEQNITDAQAKEVIQKYLRIWGTYEGDPLEMLQLEMPDYITENIDYEDTIVENGISYVNTNAVYDALEYEMKKYMSYEMFNQYFSSFKNDINPFKNVNGLLYVVQLGASGAYYEVIEVERMSRNGEEYGYNVYVNTIYGDTTKQETYYFELLNVDGNMIVTSIGVG